MRAIILLLVLAAAPLLAGDNPPYGAAVAGKPGFVKSPHAPAAGMVDVRGFPADTELKCPYTTKIFLVPAEAINVPPVVEPGPAAPHKIELPVAIPVFGKPGFVFSPFTESTVHVDVNGKAPGTVVKCPFSGRQFRVP